MIVARLTDDGFSRNVIHNMTFHTIAITLTIYMPRRSLSRTMLRLPTHRRQSSSRNASDSPRADAFMSAEPWARMPRQSFR